MTRRCCCGFQTLSRSPQQQQANSILNTDSPSSSRPLTTFSFTTTVTIEQQGTQCPAHSLLPLSLIRAPADCITMSALIILVALFSGGDMLFNRRANAASTHASGPIWPDAPLSAQSSFYYADYKVPQVHKSKFLPDIPHCPQTGRTVCSDIAKYPL